MVSRSQAKRIKGFIGIVAATPLAGLVASEVGATSAIPKGIREVTQIGIGVGLLGESAKLINNKKNKRRIL